MQIRFLVRSVLFVIAFSSVAVLGLSAPAAACSWPATFSIDLLALEGADPEDPLSILADDYALWQGDKTLRSPSREPLPLLVGVWFERTIVRVEGSEDWMGHGGVAVVDEVWGATPRTKPQEYYVDYTTCAGSYEPPDGGKFELYFEGESWFLRVEKLRDADEELRVKEILTSLFGEPTRPARSASAEQAALANVTSYRESANAESIVWIEPEPDTGEPELLEEAGTSETSAPAPEQLAPVDTDADERETAVPETAVEAGIASVERTRAFLWIVTGLAVVAFAALAGFALGRSRY